MARAVTTHGDIIAGKLNIISTIEPLSKDKTPQPQHDRLISALCHPTSLCKILGNVRLSELCSCLTSGGPAWFFGGCVQCARSAIAKPYRLREWNCRPVLSQCRDLKVQDQGVNRAWHAPSGLTDTLGMSSWSFLSMCSFIFVKTPATLHALGNNTWLLFKICLNHLLKLTISNYSHIRG